MAHIGTIEAFNRAFQQRDDAGMWIPNSPDRFTAGVEHVQPDTRNFELSVSRQQVGRCYETRGTARRQRPDPVVVHVFRGQEGSAVVRDPEGLPATISPNSLARSASKLSQA